MPFDPKQHIQPCILCESASNWSQYGCDTEIVRCSLCGEFQVSISAASDFNLPLRKQKEIALARYLLRRMQRQESHPLLDASFFQALRERHLPSPAEACDNAIKWFAEKGDYRPGPIITCTPSDERVWAEVGVLDKSDLEWVLASLVNQDLLQDRGSSLQSFRGNLTALGWERFEELQRAHVSSNYAFFARQFKNADLDKVYESCLRPAVQQTGFDLRTVPQRAGPIDAIIEDDIRRCKFLIADLSDDNAGAYWEAGFAEGLGKPVIYLCRKTVDGKEKKTHFDTDHRHTVRWDLSSLDETAQQLKAVIRNSLLGDAKQDD